MKSDTFKFRLGVFVLTGVGLGIAGLVAIGAGRFLEETRPVHFYFQESVQGLEEGSEIKYLGVRIGRVSTVRMSASESEPAAAEEEANGPPPVIHVIGDYYPEKLVGTVDHLRMSGEELDDYFRVRCAYGLRARLVWKGITGEKYLEIGMLDPKEHPQPVLPLEPARPYIPVASDASLADIQRDFARTVASLAEVDFNELGTKVTDLLESLQTQVENLNTDELAAEASATLRAVRELAESDELRSAVERSARIAEKLESAAGRIDEMLGREDLDQAIADLAAAAGSMRRSMQEIESRVPTVLEELERTLADARGAIAAADVPTLAAKMQGSITEVGGAARSVVSMREDVRRALRDVSEASRAMESLARLLEERPDALLTGKRPREEDQ